MQEADFALSGMSLTASRAAVSDATSGFYFDDIILMTTFPESVPVGWTFYIRPFHWLVFVLVGCGLVFTTLMLVLMERNLGEVWRGAILNEGQTRLPPITVSVVKAAETVFGGLLGRGNVPHNAFDCSDNNYVNFSVHLLPPYFPPLSSYQNNNNNNNNNR